MLWFVCFQMDPSFANSTFQSKITEAADIVVGTCYMVFGKPDFMVHMFIELLLCLVQQREINNFESQTCFWQATSFSVF